MFLSLIILGGTTRREQRIFVNSWGILGVASIQQEGALGQYMQGTGSVGGERKLSLTVHYKQEGVILQGALIVLIKGWTVQEKVRKKPTNLPSYLVKYLMVQLFWFHNI